MDILGYTCMGYHEGSQMSSCVNQLWPIACWLTYSLRIWPSDIIELDDGKIFRNPPILDGKNHRFPVRFSRKPNPFNYHNIHFMQNPGPLDHWTILRVISTSLGIAHWGQSQCLGSVQTVGVFFGVWRWVVMNRYFVELNGSAIYSGPTNGRIPKRNTCGCRLVYDMKKNMDIWCIYICWWSDKLFS